MTPHPQTLKDPCNCCQYKSQACAYWLDGKKFESACIDKRRHLKEATHTPAAPAMEYTIEQIAEIDNRIRKERKAERKQVLELLSDLKGYADGEYEESNLSDNEREMRIHLEYTNRIWGIMKSLRGGGAP